MDMINTSDRVVRNGIIVNFPGYKFYEVGEWPFGGDDPEAKHEHNYYKGIDVGFGGYIYGQPGIYTNVALLDVTSLHPSSIINMNAFGEYTQNYKDILTARIYIKHHEYDKAKKLLDGALEPYLDDVSMADQLAQATKIVINSVYGLTSAKFDNPFKDKRNKNNIVALRGALFMIDLKEAVEQKGYTVVSIRTDSIKIADADNDIIDYCVKFAKAYGYNFEYESHYEKMCLVNMSAYIAKYSHEDVNGKHKGEWTATAAQFQQPYVYKTLFSHEPITFKDKCETKEVKTSLYLDFNEKFEDISDYEKDYNNRLKAKKSGKECKIKFPDMTLDELKNFILEHHDFHFVGKVGEFCPIKPGCGGGELYRSNKDGTGFSSATGAKDYRWMESEMVKKLGYEDRIDISYYTKLVDAAVADISQYGDFEWFVS